MNELTLETLVHLAVKQGYSREQVLALATDRNVRINNIAEKIYVQALAMRPFQHSMELNEVLIAQCHVRAKAFIEFQDANAEPRRA